MSVTDQITNETFKGSSLKYVYNYSYAFRIPKTNIPWYSTWTTDQPWNYSGDLTIFSFFDRVNPERILSSSEITFDNTYFWLVPSTITDWSAVNDYVITVSRRPASTQNFSPSSQSGWGISSLIAELDKTQKQVQAIGEQVRRSIKFHPSDVDYITKNGTYTGQEVDKVIDNLVTIPPQLESGDNKGKVLGFDTILNHIIPKNPDEWGYDPGSGENVNYPGTVTAGAVTAGTVTANSLKILGSTNWNTAFGIALGSGWPAALAVAFNSSIASFPPVGETYIQTASKSDPGTLYPGTTWTDISWQLNGCALRYGQDVSGNAFVAGTPAKITVAITSGVPLFTIVSGGSGYLAGSSGTLTLTLVGACTTQCVLTATVTSGVITNITISTAGAGYTSGKTLLYDNYFTFPDMGQMHRHKPITTGDAFTNTRSGSSQGFSGTSLVAVGATTTGDPTTDGANGAYRGGAENTTAYSFAKMWKRVA